MAPEKHKNLDQEIKELISSLFPLHRHPKSGGSSHSYEEEEGGGGGVITLAGSNVGAAMQGGATAEEKLPAAAAAGEEPSSVLVNSNFQAINNSIMFGGSYRTNDPGIHLDISEHLDNKKHKPAKEDDDREDEEED